MHFFNKILTDYGTESNSESNFAFGRVNIGLPL